MINRTTSENINSLSENEIFVFGSNLSGRHGRGAAKTALGWGARWGQAKGLQGKTYGIPTKDASIKRTLTIKEIKPFVDEFIEFARANQNLIFLVTEIGCGLAGLKPKEIAPLFKDAINIPNIHLPYRFWNKLYDNSMSYTDLTPSERKIASIRKEISMDIASGMDIQEARKKANEKYGKGWRERGLVSDSDNQWSEEDLKNYNSNK